MPAIIFKKIRWFIITTYTLAFINIISKYSKLFIFIVLVDYSVFISQVIILTSRIKRKGIAFINK